VHHFDIEAGDMPPFQKKYVHGVDSLFICRKLKATYMVEEIL
jgi:hypothetical protein